MMNDQNQKVVLKMGLCKFDDLDPLSLFDVENAIISYCKKYRIWVKQYDEYFWKNRLTLSLSERMIKLLELVSGSGWNMNRQGQCQKIIKDIKSGNISQEKLKSFWDVVDKLSNVQLRNLPYASPKDLSEIKISFDIIQQTLCKWHNSAGTVCFLTKVILMFNWGQSPAFDSKVRKALGIKKDYMSTNELMQALIDIGCWIKEFEINNRVRLDEFSTTIMEQTCQDSLEPLPLGRSFDMLLFSL